MNCRWCGSLILMNIAHRHGVCIPCMKKHKEKEASKKQKKREAKK